MRDSDNTFQKRVLPARAGYGIAHDHHGELFQGVVCCDDGHLRRGLVTMPCGLFKSEAIFTPDTTGIMRVEPSWKTKTRKAAELALAESNRKHWGGLLTIYSDIPPGWGLGSSTSDVIAAIRAIASSFDENLDPLEVAALAVKAETASDSTMFDGQVVLFAQREGIVIEDFEQPFPEFEVLGFNTDPTQRGVDTLSFAPARYTWWQIEAFQPMIGLLRRAIKTQNSRLAGQVATASAVINQQFLPKPHFDDFRRITEKAEAVGLQIAHTGTIVGIMFDPKDPNTEDRICKTRSLISRLGYTKIWRFSTRPDKSNEAKIKRCFDQKAKVVS